MSLKLLGLGLAALTVASAPAVAANLVSNGGFELSSYGSNSQFGGSFGGQGVTDWTGLGTGAAGGGQNLQFYYKGGTQTTTNAVNQYGDPDAYFYSSFTTLSPDGGNFVALDGDSSYFGQVSQTINGLTAGQSYLLKFSWGATQLKNRSGDTTEQLAIGFGSSTASTAVVANPSGAFTGWFNESFTFTATSASQVLSFMSVGTPGGLPPIAVLDGVSLNAVPEPATWALMLVGFGMVGAAARRRTVRVAA